MNTIDLALLRTYYDQIIRGTKKHEYRDGRNVYYTQKFLNVDAYDGKTAKDIKEGLLNGTIKDLKLKGLTHLRFHNTGRMCVVEVKGIKFDRQNKLWDISLGKVLSGKV